MNLNIKSPTQINSWFAKSTIIIVKDNEITADVKPEYNHDLIFSQSVLGFILNM